MPSQIPVRIQGPPLNPDPQHWRSVKKRRKIKKERERTGPEIRIIGSFGEGPTAPGLALAKWLEGRSTACRHLKGTVPQECFGGWAQWCGGLALAKWLGGRFTWRAGTLTEKSHENNSQNPTDYSLGILQKKTL